MNKINEAVQKKIEGARVARQDESKDTVVAQTPTFANNAEEINACADIYDNVVAEREKETDGITPDEKKMKAHLDESLFEDYIEEKDENTDSGDVYTYAHKYIIEDRFDEREAIPSDHNNMGDYDIGVYCKNKEGEKEIEDFGDRMLLFTKVERNKSETSDEYPYIHIIYISDSVATTSTKEYKKKYGIE